MSYLVTDSFTSHALLPQAGVSNIWRIGPGFTIGANWVSLSIPIVFPSGFDSDKVEEQAEADGVDFEDKLQTKLNMFHTIKSSLVIGWTF